MTADVYDQRAADTPAGREAADAAPLTPELLTGAGFTPAGPQTHSRPRLVLIWNPRPDRIDPAPDGWCLVEGRNWDSGGGRFWRATALVHPGPLVSLGVRTWGDLRRLLEFLGKESP